MTEYDALHARPALQSGKVKGGGRRRSETIRRRVLAAAIELLGQATLQSVTSEAIAAKAGVSKATIYRWWSSKASVVIDAFIEHQALHTPMDMEIHPAEALLKHWRLMATQYAGKSGRIASQIIAAGQSDPAIMDEFLRKFLAERRAMSLRAVEKLMRTCPAIRQRVDEEMFMELLYSPIQTRLLLRHMPIDQEFIVEFPLTFFRVFGVEFDGDGHVVAVDAPG